MGIFDGNGFSISGLFINKEENYKGIFGVVENANITNLVLSNSYISGSRFIGGIIGKGINSDFEGCVNNATVSAISNVGGIVGEYEITGGAHFVKNCINNGMIIAKGSYFDLMANAGGLIGYINSSSVPDIMIEIYQSSNTGTLISEEGNAVGGLVGYWGIASSISQITTCYNMGEVFSSGSYAAGIVGTVEFINKNAGYFYIIDAYNAGNITAAEGPCGIISSLSHGEKVTIISCYNVGYLNATDYDDGCSPFTQAIVGNQTDGQNYTAIDCYYLDTCNSFTDLNATILTDEEMKNSDSFNGYEFQYMYTMDGCPNYEYPEYNFVGATHDLDMYSDEEFKILKKPTCISPGIKYVECNLCKEKLTVTIPVLNHNWVLGNTVLPTCTESGYDEVTCLICGLVSKTNIVSASGHEWEVKEIPPTCTENGYTLYTCLSCKETKKGNPVPSLEHMWDDGIVTPSTCTESGYITYTCINCHESKIEELGVSLGHIWVENEITEPTCSVGGYITFNCSNCTEIKIEDTLPASGHNLDPIKKTCMNRNCEYSEYFLGDSNYDGEVNDMDDMIFARYLANWDVEMNLYAADIDHNGEVDDFDNMLMSRYLAGWDIICDIGIYTNNNK